MATYDAIRALVEHSSELERLQILHAESKRILSSLQGYSQLIYNLGKEREFPNMPDDFLTWCERVVNYTSELGDLIDAITDQKHGSLLQQEKAERDRKLGEELWKDAQEGLPELLPYSGLREAVELIANQLDLFFNSVKIDDSFLHPGGLVHYFGADAERRARIGTQREQLGKDYKGYSLTLCWLIDHRNRKWRYYESLSPNIRQAVLVLHSWLVEEQELAELIAKNEWLENGKYTE